MIVWPRRQFPLGLNSCHVPGIVEGWALVVAMTAVQQGTDSGAMCRLMASESQSCMSACLPMAQVE
jgi:hypothetical protein